MKIYIVGSIKIDSRWRKKLFEYNLISLEPISSLFHWNLNIAGKYAEFSRAEIMKRYSQAHITIDNDSSFYKLVKAQVSTLETLSSEAMLFFWQEDHWFICPHKKLFLYLLDKFKNSKAEILTVTHLIESWKNKNIHKPITDKKLYREYLINSYSQKELCKTYPGSYLTSIPGIHKKGIVLEMLETNKPITDILKKPNYELYGQGAEVFLTKRSFIEMVPAFHVFREVFKFNQKQEAINIKQALQIIRLRKNQEFLQHFGIWVKIINMILAPRATGGRIKRKILK